MKQIIAPFILDGFSIISETQMSLLGMYPKHNFNYVYKDDMIVVCESDTDTVFFFNSLDWQMTRGHAACFAVWFLSDKNIFVNSKDLHRIPKLVLELTNEPKDMR